MVMLLILGVSSIRNFAAPICVGVISGCYSSVCISGPLWNLFSGQGRKRQNSFSNHFCDLHVKSQGYSAGSFALFWRAPRVGKTCGAVVRAYLLNFLLSY